MQKNPGFFRTTGVVFSNRVPPNCQTSSSLLSGNSAEEKETWESRETFKNVTAKKPAFWIFLPILFLGFLTGMPALVTFKNGFPNPKHQKERMITINCLWWGDREIIGFVTFPFVEFARQLAPANLLNTEKGAHKYAIFETLLNVNQFEIPSFKIGNSNSNRNVSFRARSWPPFAPKIFFFYYLQSQF